MTPDEVAKRLDNRAGYELITYREVGLPIFGILATALLLEDRLERVVTYDARLTVAARELGLRVAAPAGESVTRRGGRR